MKKLSHKPPGCARWILKILIPKKHYETLLGDLDEMYTFLYIEHGKKKTGWWYRIQVLKTLYTFILQKIYWSTAMFNNYLKIALRNMKRHKSYSLINIAGLAIGMACCILILLYIQFELSFDKYHEKADRIYLLKRFGNFGGTENTSSANNALVAGLMKKDFPEIANAVRIGFMPNPAVKYEENKFYEDKVIYADDSFLNIFTYPMIQGDPKTALEVPYSVVITEEIADKYFGSENPLGKSLRFNNKDDFTVTGVIKNIPRNSHLLFNMVCSFQTLYQQYEKGHPHLNNFTSNVFRTYIMLKEGVNPDVLTQKFPNFIEEYGGKKLKALGISIEYFLMPLTDIHLHTPLSGGRSGIGQILYVYVFTLIAIFILLIACINFMNLATARSAKRAQEVGMRKVLGAVKEKLVIQFLCESVFYSFCSLILSLLLVQLALPLMNSIAGYELTLSFSKLKWLLPGLIGIAIVVGFIAGSYPAFFLSRFQPVKVLKGSIISGTSNSLFRNILVVLQFSISVTLIIGSLIIIRQLNYMKNKNPGFNKEQVVIIPFRDEQLRNSIETIKTELSGYSGIMYVSASSDIPGQYPQYNSKLPEGFPRDQYQLMYDLNVYYDFIPAMGMELVAGRNFSREFGTDQRTAVIINETAAKEFGWENPVGKKIGDYTGIKTVIGVVRDYHQLPLSEEIKPLFIRITPEDIYNPYNLLSIRISPGDISRTIDYIRDTWNTIYPNHPFDYFFLDESFNEQFRETERLRGIFSYFAGLAIFIACLGLFGLASFTAEQRTKEIGIRKVMGATTPGIVIMLAKELIKLVLISNAIAWPVAYLIMKNWLYTFPYREHISFITFVVSGLIVLIIGIVTISYQSIRAGLANPINSLKYE